MLETTAPIAVFRTGQGIVPHPKVGRAGWAEAAAGGLGRWAAQQDGTGGYHGGGGGGYHGGGGRCGSPGPESI